MFNFRNRLGMLACAGMLSVAASANAATFDFSYTFGDGRAITGSVDGTLDVDGSTIEDLTNLHVVFDGADFGGSVTLANWDDATLSFDLPGTISTNGALNDFYVSEPTGTYSFGLVNDDTNGSAAWAVNQNLVANNTAYDSPVNASWTVAAVPEPAAVALLLAGFGIAGFSARRRRAA